EGSDAEEDESAILQRLITKHQKDFGRTNTEDEHFLNLTCAAVALAIDDIVTACSASDVTDIEQQQQYADNRDTIKKAFEAATNKLLAQLPPEATHPFDRPSTASDNADYTPIISTRQRHRTKMEALIRQYNGNAQGVGTGLERRARWQVGKKDSGNTVNTALAAGQRAATLYEQVHTNQFRAILRQLAPLQTFAFALVSGESFLRLLPSNHRFSPDWRTLALDLDPSTQTLLAQLQMPDILGKLALATKALHGACRK
ncbi:hypothetical protein GY45DRAFT_1209705, partial [Cubamyces sp. BRFM 1775]